jgi:hypothetical protein
MTVSIANMAQVWMDTSVRSAISMNVSTLGAGSNTSSKLLRLGIDGATKFSVDSTGRVTSPSQPLFMGTPTTDYSGGSMPTGTMAITATYNNGNHFSSNQFTAPVAGWYRTTWGGLQLPSTVTSLQVNGSDVHNGNHYPASVSYITMTQTTIRYLNANDYMSIRQWNGGGYYSGWWIWTVDLIA